MKSHSAGSRDEVDSAVAVGAAAHLTALNQLFSNLQPIILAALVHSLGFADAALGQASAAFIGLNTLCIVSAPLWIRSVNWRTISFIASAAAALLAITGLWLTSLPQVLALFAAIGFINGLMGAPAFTALGDTRDPNRTYSIALIAQSLLAAAASVPLSGWIAPRYGLNGVYLTLAAIFATGLLAARLIPARGRAASQEHTSEVGAPFFSTASIPPIVSLLAVFSFVGGALGFWFFSERIGASRGVGPALIGTTIALSAFTTIASAGIVAWVGNRLPTMAYVAGGTVVTLLGFALLRVPGDIAFVGAVFLFAGGYGFAQPGYWSASRQVDATGRLFVATPAAGGVAGVLMGLAAGPIIETSGYSGLVLWCSALLVAGAVFLALAIVLANQANRASRGGLGLQS